MLRTLATALILTLFAAAAAGAQDAARIETLAGELAREAGTRAEALTAAPGRDSAPADPYDSFVLGVQEFAAEAMTLSRHIEAVDGANDLKCIFRGMSEDALSRLEMLSEPARNAERARTYQAFAALFEDAQIIAADEDTVSVAALPCPAEAEHNSLPR